MRVADDLVRPGFRPAAPNLLWCADITYLESRQRRCYLAATPGWRVRDTTGVAWAEQLHAD